MKAIYRVRFVGRLIHSQGHTTELQKTLVFDTPQDFESVRLELYKTHEHIRILSMVDLSRAGAYREMVGGEK